MLALLLGPSYDHLHQTGDKAIIAETLDKEMLLLNDIGYLEKNVIGSPGEFEWEPNVLQEGFLRIVSPFMVDRAQISGLFFYAMRQLGLDPLEYRRAVIMIEYSYYSAIINDYHTFHDEFSNIGEDFTIAQRLTQIQYTGQFLAHYPRHFLINNIFGLSHGVICEIHRWITNIYICLGMGRGVFVKWSQRLFRGIAPQHYFQNCIDIACIYILFPVILASLFAGVRDKQLRLLKEALAWFTLWARLRLEEQVYLGAIRVASDCNAIASSTIPFQFQGLAFIRSKIDLSSADLTPARYPRAGELVQLVAKHVAVSRNDIVLAEYRSEQEKAMARIQALIKQCGLFTELGEIIVASQYV